MPKGFDVGSKELQEESFYGALGKSPGQLAKRYADLERAGIYCIK